jgi:hypothetical protein
VSESDPERRAAAEDRPADRWLRTYLEDSMLWPTLIVWAALLLLAGMTFSGVSSDLRRRRFGLVSRAVVGIWVASAGAALLALHLGLA